MKKIIVMLMMLFTLTSISQTQYKYCQLIGMTKLFSFKLVVAVDSGGSFQYDMITDTIEKKTAASFKNEKVYVTTNETVYEGKTVNSDAKGKFIWKQVEVGGTTEKKTKIKTFTSMIDGMNYMGALGWEFVQAYTITTNNQNVYHYILKHKR